MDSFQRGVRFQGYTADTVDMEDGNISRNQTPTPRNISNGTTSNLAPQSPRTGTTIPSQQQQQQQQQQHIPRQNVQGYFPMELPIDYNIPSLVEEGGFLL